MPAGATTTVKCPACGKFVAQITGISAQVLVNCKTRKCGCVLQLNYDDGQVTVGIIGKSNEYTPAKR